MLRFYKLMLPFFFTCYQTLEVGLMDAIEFRYVNKEVFYQHNFPDILGTPPKQVYKQGAYHAFVSGIKCCPLLLLPCLAKTALLARSETLPVNQLFKIHLWLAAGLLVGDLLILSTFNPNLHNIYRNHDLFYKLHIGIELISLGVCLIS